MDGRPTLGTTVQAPFRARSRAACGALALSAASPARGRGLAEHHHLQERGGAGLRARQARRHADPHAGLAPTELDHAARRVGDEALGRRVAVDRGGLHAPVGAAAPHRLLAGGEREDRHRRAVRREDASRAAGERRHDQRVEAEGADRLARGVGDGVVRTDLRAGDAFGVPLAVRRLGSVARAIASSIATASTGYAPTAVSWLSITASVPSRIAFATSVASARVGRELVTIESSICVAVIDGRASRPAARRRRFCTIGICSMGARRRGRRGRP